MYIDVRKIGYYLRCIEANQKAPWMVLLHGFMGSGRSFDYLISHLKGRINLITVDLLGHGQTQSATDIKRFELNEQLRDLEQLFQQITPEFFYIYGYSMGGRLALRYAARNRNSIGGLILESTHEGIRDSHKRNQRKKVDHQWAGWIEEDFEDFLDWWQQLDLFQSPDKISDNRYKHYRTIQASQDPKQMAMSLRSFGQGSVKPAEDALKGLEIPVLVGAGEYDDKYVKRMSHLYDLLPNAKLNIIPQAAHRIHLDAPEKWSTIIREFVTNNFENSK